MGLGPQGDERKPDGLSMVHIQIGDEPLSSWDVLLLGEVAGGRIRGDVNVIG